MTLGANVVGGIPCIEFTDANAAAHIGICFDLAQRFNKAVSINFAIAPGAPLNLAVLDQQNVVEALRFHAPPAHVIAGVRLVDQAKMNALLASN